MKPLGTMLDDSEKKQLLQYSLFLSIGSICFFIFLNGVYTTIQAMIWYYSARYLVSSVTLTLVYFFSSILFFISCYLIIKKREKVIIPGILGCLLILIYPMYILLVEITVPYNFNYSMILIIPAMVILCLGIFFRKKIT